jgi:regulator of replication initiation timing
LQAIRLEDQLKDAERHKADLKKQIENYMNDEHTLNGENAKVFPFLSDDLQ